MNNLCTDIGYNSLFKHDEELCGDKVAVLNNEDSSLVVLADGMGSGVKANILSTLTSKIISTMLSQGMKLEDCVETVAATLPVCSVRKAAYSTFTIIRISDGENAEFFQYDNPDIIMLRNGENLDYPKELLEIGGKNIYRTKIKVCEGDIIIAMSDGVPHAGIGMSMNFGWSRENIIEFMTGFAHVGFTAKTLTTILLDECYGLYGGEPGDDATVCTIKIRSRVPMNLVIGPPSNRDDCSKMMSLFFSKQGKHIVCGGTTSSIAADYLGKKVVTSLDFPDPDIPPISHIDGVDLVTEGVITFSKVLKYAEDYLADNESYKNWITKKDGASLISQLLFEEATDINFFVGRAVNPAHQNPNLPINFNIKMRLVDNLSECLKNMGKRIKVIYF